MSDTIRYIRIFNETVGNFFQELMEIFPEEPRIESSYNTFKALCKINIRKPCENFMISIIPFLEKIAMRDESFFIGENMPEFLKSINFKNIWTPDLSINTKNAIWKYIQSFIIMGNHAIALPPETEGLINYIINYK